MKHYFGTDGSTIWRYHRVSVLVYFTLYCLMELTTSFLLMMLNLRNRKCFACQNCLENEAWFPNPKRW